MPRLLCVVLQLGLCLCFVPSSTTHITKNLELFSEERTNLTWPRVNLIIKQLVDSAVNPYAFDVLKFAIKANLSEKCQEAVIRTIDGLRNSEGWAVKMFDATGKIPSGILDGTVMDFGSYEECVGIKSNSSSPPDSDQDLIVGQYCMVGFKTPLLWPLDEKTESGQSYAEAYGNHPDWIDDVLRKGKKFLKKVRFWFGVCSPSVCNKQDLKNAFGLLSKPGFDVKVLDCHTDVPLEWTNYQIAAVSFISTIGAAVLIGLVLDVLPNFVPDKVLGSLNSNMFAQVLRTFSIYSNTEMLLKSDTAVGNLDFFGGIRFFSAAWIILGHTFFFTDTWKFLKFRGLMGVPDTFSGQFPMAVVENFTIPVGSFFFMSGFLLTYTNWRKLEESEGRTNLVTFFIHKYWRMTPAQVATIVLFFAMPLISSGPLWKSTLDPPTDACQKTWWANLFYIQNWWTADDFCLLHTWFLAALMQFHICGILLLLLVYRYPLVGTASGFLIIVGCSVLTGILAAWHNFPMPAPGTVKDLDAMVEYISVIYIKPYTHISTYIIGMIIGYLVLKYPAAKVSPSLQAVGWFLAALCGLAVVLGIYGPSKIKEVRAVYISLHRIGWALVLGWLTFCCAAGNAGIVNRILSWKALAPLGQLSYLAYLLHPLVLWYRTASLRERIYFGYTELVYSFISHMVVGFFLAYVCYVTVELPFSKLENLLFSRVKTSVFKIGVPVKYNDRASNVRTLSVKSTEP